MKQLHVELNISPRNSVSIHLYKDGNPIETMCVRRDQLPTSSTTEELYGLNTIIHAIDWRKFLGSRRKIRVRNNSKTIVFPDKNFEKYFE